MPLSNPISVWIEGGFDMPLGIVPVDAGLAQALVAADPRITADFAAHEGEHPIKIELPFLQRVCSDCRIVPLLIGADDDETMQALADALIKLLPGRRAVVIAGSDLSHCSAYIRGFSAGSPLARDIYRSRKRRLSSLCIGRRSPGSTG